MDVDVVFIKVDTQHEAKVELLMVGDNMSKILTIYILLLNTTEGVLKMLVDRYNRGEIEDPDLKSALEIIDGLPTTD